jgi:hypothetical protein
VKKRLILLLFLVKLLYSEDSKYDTFESLTVVYNDCDVQIKEGSDLAYDKNKKILYIIGDKGDLFTCSVEADKNSITLNYLNSTSIVHNLSLLDSEGLAYIPSKDELVLSTEGNSSSAGIYSMNLEGNITGKYDLPMSLDNAVYKGLNLKFEALGYSKDFGIITATENPVNSELITNQTIYSKDKKWLFKAEDVYIDKSADSFIENSVVAIADISNSPNEILVLERAYERKDIGFLPNVKFIITIKKVDLGTCEYKEYSDNYKGNECATLVLKKFETTSYSGNYEGLTEINDGLFLMINDNQDKISTQFKYFNIKNKKKIKNKIL